MFAGYHMNEDVECIQAPGCSRSWCLATGFSSEFHELLKRAEEENLPDAPLRAFPLERLPLFAEAEESATNGLCALVPRYVHPRIMHPENLAKAKIDLLESERRRLFTIDV